MKESRHEERAMALLGSVGAGAWSEDKPSVLMFRLRELIALALSQAEGELIARMMEPTQGMLDAATSAINGDDIPDHDYDEDATTIIKAATKQFAHDNGISIPEEEGSGKDVAAVSLGKRGGKARAKALSKKERVKIAKKAAKARWKSADKKKGEHF